MKKNTQIIVVFIAVLLIITTAFLIWKSSTSSEDTFVIDTLEVNYSKSSDSALSDLPAAEINYYSIYSKYIVSATVSELKNIDGSKEGYLDVNKVLKGNIEVNQILLRTWGDEPELKEGDNYILFIYHIEQDNINYYYLPSEGYLLKTGLVYKGMNPPKSFTYIGVKSRLLFVKLFEDSDGRLSAPERLFMWIIF